MATDPVHPRVISADIFVPAAARPRIGLLYPRGGSAFEYYQFAEALNDNVRCYLVGGMHSYGGAKTHYTDALFRMGAVENLAYPARSMRPLDVHAVLWCSTSASFIGGRAWSEAQAGAIGEIVGAPGSNTALSFVAAIRAMGAVRVAVLASYPREATEAFVAFLGEHEVAVTAFRAYCRRSRRLHAVGSDSFRQFNRPRVANRSTAALPRSKPAENRGFESPDPTRYGMGYLRPGRRALYRY